MKSYTVQEALAGLPLVLAVLLPAFTGCAGHDDTAPDDAAPDDVASDDAAPDDPVIVEVSELQATHELPAVQGTPAPDDDATGCGERAARAGLVVAQGAPSALHPASAPREAVAAGAFHSLYLRDDGTVWAWGHNGDGQLGDGTVLTPRATPVRTVNLPPIAAIAAGGFHSLALDTAGHLWSWGLNTFGQLGAGTAGSTPSRTPGRIQPQSGDPTFIAIAAGHQFSMALDATGRVWTWGSNVYGQRGTGAVGGNNAVPEPLLLPGTFARIAAGWNHALAVDAEGTLWTWGRNNAGQIGSGTFSPTQIAPQPQPVNLPQPVIAVAGGGSHSLSLLSDGTVHGWGSNSHGELGLGTTNSPIPTPQTLLGPSGVSQLAAGNTFSLVLRGATGQVLSFGQNTFGQLGDTTLTNRTTPTPITLSLRVLAIAAGSNHALALTADCPVWAWGQNNLGQLGLGSTALAQQPKPTQTLALRRFYRDTDGDGHGDPAHPVDACTAPPGTTSTADDCDDTDAHVSPAAVEICNGRDDDCDGQVDESDPAHGKACLTGARGECAVGALACQRGTLTCMFTTLPSHELCDGLDNDCDGRIDEDCPDVPIESGEARDLDLENAPRE
ncbi:MopE-related protein [Chondromyces crocatus]|uniref:RCC1-like domain-containing protein n=1 Tax=Chondromyces crocatus TaxID=52 RepID=A0A0K1EK69_CHOCO|nr:MopE-related protein [Chondromyces crocatus]AKT40998.1 uncharacterized protein CMC5_051550 [Chondromyces crocatus]